MVNRLLYNTAIHNDRKLQTETHSGTPQDVVFKFVSLPYIEKLTHKLVHLFNSTIDNIKIAQFNIVTNRINFTSTKDKICRSNISDVVYRIPCSGCDAVYVGQTSQQLKKRLALHKSDSKLRPQRCALASHAHSTGHSIDYEGVQIVEREDREFLRTFLEMCHINDSDNAMNAKTDVDNLSSIYKYLLFLEKNKYRMQQSSFVED